MDPSDPDGLMEMPGDPTGLDEMQEGEEEQDDATQTDETQTEEMSTEDGQANTTPRPGIIHIEIYFVLLKGAGGQESEGRRGNILKGAKFPSLY